MNEDHIIAAILTAGLLAQKKDANLEVQDASSLYTECLTALLQETRPAPVS